MEFHKEILTICLLFSGFIFVSAQNIDPWEVRCHVCKATVHEMEEKVAKIDPKKTADVSGFRLDAHGNSVSKTVQYSKSEVFLTELMEEICDKMDDYAKTTNKKTGKFTLMKFMINGQMNPDISNVDFVQDGDLNKSLKHYCLEILEDQEEIFLQQFMKQQLSEDLDIKICSEMAKYCKDGPVQEDYTLEEDDDFKDEL